MRSAFTMLVVTSLTACTVNVNIYDHRKMSVAPEPASRGRQVASNQYAEFYFNSTPVNLARIRLVSDGKNNEVDKFLGTTPLTIRMSPGVTQPFNSSVCGQTIIVLYEMQDYRTQKVAHTISCFSSLEKAEKSPNEILGALTPEKSP